MAPPDAVSRSGSGYVLHLGRDERDRRRAPARRAARRCSQAPATPDALRRLFPVVHPDEPRAGGRVPAADARRAGHQPAGRHRHGDRGARAAGPQGAARRGRAAGVRAGRQQHPPRARHGARRHRGRRGSTRPTSSPTPPSTTSTATCRGCSTRPCGRCPATSPTDLGGILANHPSGRDPRRMRRASPPRACRRAERAGGTGQGRC